MSSQNLIFLNRSCGNINSLTSTERQVLAFLNERGHKIINFHLLQARTPTQVYEQTLSLFRAKPTVIAIIDQPMGLQTVLLTIGFLKQCRTLGFCHKDLYLEFRAITSTFLQIFQYEDSLEIINALKLLAL